MADASRTRAERLDALVRKIAPKRAAYMAKHGVWPTADDLTTPPTSSRTAAGSKTRSGKDRDASGPAAASDHRGRQAPYTIDTLAGDRRRIRVVGDDGDTVTGTGDTLEAALAALEAKRS